MDRRWISYFCRGFINRQKKIVSNNYVKKYNKKHILNNILKYILGHI